MAVSSSTELDSLLAELRLEATNTLQRLDATEFNQVLNEARNRRHTQTKFEHFSHVVSK